MNPENLIPLILKDIADDALMNVEEPIRTHAEAWAVIQERLDIFWAAVKNPRPGPTAYRHLVGVGVACVESAMDLYNHAVLPDAAQEALSRITCRPQPKISSLHDAYGRFAILQNEFAWWCGQGMVGGGGAKTGFINHTRTLLSFVIVVAADLDLRAEEFPTTGDGPAVAQAA